MRRFSPDRLRQAREAAGKSRERLAVDVDRSYETVVGYELRGKTPPLEVLLRVADALGVDVAELLEDDDREAVAS